MHRCAAWRQVRSWDPGFPLRLILERQRAVFAALHDFHRSALDRDDLDAIDGLAPVICIDQRRGTANPRSTVATTTEIYDFLRLLYARLGDGQAITAEDDGDSKVRIADEVPLAIDGSERLSVSSAMV